MYIVRHRANSRRTDFLQKYMAEHRWRNTDDTDGDTNTDFRRFYSALRHHIVSGLLEGIAKIPAHVATDGDLVSDIKTLELIICPKA